MPLLPVALSTSLAVGIAVSLAGDLGAAWALQALACATGVAALGLWRQWPRVTLAASLAGACLSGVALGADADHRARRPALQAAIDAWHADSAAPVEGVLVADASAGVSGVALRVAVEQLGDVRSDGAEQAALTVGGTLAAAVITDWRAGRRVRLAATLRRPAHYLNPGVPDDRLALARRGLVLVGGVKSAPLVEVVARGTWRQERSADLRAYVRRALASRVGVHDPTAAAVATALLIGDRAGLDAAVEEKLKAAGTYHVIAISGGNIAVLTALLLGAARLAQLPYRLAGPLVALLLVAHAGMVGGGPSVARATTMAVIYLGLRTLDQSARSLNALAAAVGLLLAADPLAIVDAGFILSVGATGAIIVLVNRVAGRGRWGPFHRAAAGVVGASAATEVVLLPVSATLFGRVTVAGLMLNLAAVPMMGVVQVAAMATLVLHDVVSPLAAAAGWVTAGAARLLVSSAVVVDWLPWLVFRTPPPAWPVVVAYAAGLAAAVASLQAGRGGGRPAARLRRAGIAATVVSGCWILAAPGTWRWPWRADGVLRVVFLDVGQGDATLVEFPDGTRALVDAGGLPGATTFDIGARVVAPALWARGVGRLDALLLTHGDPDHIGGAARVIDDFAPAIYEGIEVPSHEPTRRLRGHAAGRRRPWRRLAHGDRWEAGGVNVRIWHPRRPDWERQRVRNDDSVVVELRYGDVSVVLPGDVGAEVERELAGQIPPAGVRVLKAAHHGSASSTSAAWLDALGPRVAVVSCGRANRYGHPAPAVLGRLGERGIAIRRTDLEGQVVVETDGAALRVLSARAATR